MATKKQIEKYRREALSALVDIRGIDVQYERAIRAYIDLLEAKLKGTIDDNLEYKAKQCE